MWAGSTGAAMTAPIRWCWQAASRTKWWVYKFQMVFHNHLDFLDNVFYLKSFLFQDRGDEFTYTGSGGRDLSGNKRIGEHSFDQTLTHMNR